MDTMTLDGCKRCPRCHAIPVAKQEGEKQFLECEQHGYIGVSCDTLEEAIRFWNKLITFVEATNL